MFNSLQPIDLHFSFLVASYSVWSCPTPRGCPISPWAHLVQLMFQDPGRFRREPWLLKNNFDACSKAADQETCLFTSPLRFLSSLIAAIHNGTVSSPTISMRSCSRYSTYILHIWLYIVAYRKHAYGRLPVARVNLSGGVHYCTETTSSFISHFIGEHSFGLVCDISELIHKLTINLQFELNRQANIDSPEMTLFGSSLDSNIPQIVEITWLHI